jgi:hypothetical protein
VFIFFPKAESIFEASKIDEKMLYPPRGRFAVPCATRKIERLRNSLRSNRPQAQSRFYSVAQPHKGQNTANQLSARPELVEG